MKIIPAACIFLVMAGCSVRSNLPPQPSAPASSGLTGTDFYKWSAGYNWKQRDSLAVAWVLAGNTPSFLKQFTSISIVMFDSLLNRDIRAEYFVSPDYLSVGTDADWARVPVTPMAAQKIADTWDAFLPTRKMVNDIYQAAEIKLEPIPMYAFRDSTPTMYQHHLIIEGLRRGRQGLIAGIKKDVVISGKVLRDGRKNRVAIYGWHLPGGKAIQPLYTGHVDWYVDYSHGIRLVSRRMKVDGKWMDYQDVLQHPRFRKLLCDEEYCDFYKYPY